MIYPRGQNNSSAVKISCWTKCLARRHSILVCMYKAYFGATKLCTTALCMRKVKAYSCMRKISATLFDWWYSNVKTNLCNTICKPNHCFVICEYAHADRHFLLINLRPNLIFFLSKIDFFDLSRSGDRISTNHADVRRQVHFRRIICENQQDRSW